MKSGVSIYSGSYRFSGMSLWKKWPFLVSIYLLGGCDFDISNQNAPFFAPDLSEPSPWYDSVDSQLLRVDLTLQPDVGPCQGDDTTTPEIDDTNYLGCTLTDIDGDIDPADSFVPEMAVNLQIEGNSYPAHLRIRGNTSRLAEQKSYRIEIDDRNNLWRGERKLQFNKHPFDLTRVRNKLSFDLLQTIPHLPSLRTRFVQLFIDGIDYGLFTHVENVGREYLINRGWDRDSNLYSATEFSFFESPDLRLEDDPVFDQDRFDAVLEVERGHDHRMLLEMITAVNDDERPIAEVLGFYFHRENLLSWFAANILMDNKDTVSQNYYLLRFPDTHVFYFTPWDYDGAWNYSQEPLLVEDGNLRGQSQMGVTQWWQVKLLNRALRDPLFRSDLLVVIDNIYNNYLTQAAIAARISEYSVIVEPIITSLPDRENLPLQSRHDPVQSLQDYRQFYQSLNDSVDGHYQNFIDMWEVPMSFWMGEPEVSNTEVTFNWEESVDFQGDLVTYDLQISTTAEFSSNEIVLEENNISELNITLTHSLGAGNYFIRVIARDNSNPDDHWMVSFDKVTLDDGRHIFGVKELVVP